MFIKCKGNLRVLNVLKWCKVSCYWECELGEVDLKFIGELSIMVYWVLLLVIIDDLFFDLILDF